MTTASSENPTSSSSQLKTEQNQQSESNGDTHEDSCKNLVSNTTKSCATTSSLLSNDAGSSKKHLINNPVFIGPEIKVKGLGYYAEYITKEEEQEILKLIDSNEWSNAISRRTQYYGYYYYHTRHNVKEIQPIEQAQEKLYPLDPFKTLIKKMMGDGIFPPDEPPTQCLVNEYIERQKISCHVDNPACFGDVIVGLSINNPCMMKLTCEEANQETKILLEPRSIYVFKDDVRFKWKHGITRAKIITIPKGNGEFEKIKRDSTFRRISLTFRKIKVEGTRKVRDGMENDPSCTW